MCDRPGVTERDYQDHLRQLINVFGWAVPGGWSATASIRALQLVHADDRGHWPWDSWYRGVRGGQPILGIREPPERRKRVG